MCMEDFDLGRAGQGYIRSVAVSTTAVLLCATSETRIALLLTSSQSQDIWISAEPGIVVGQGMHIPAGCPPILLRIQEFCNLVRSQLFVISGAASTVGVVEGHLNKMS